MLSKMCGESLVISGISGRYPGCRNVNELKKNLFDQVDMMTDREVRWSNTTWSQLPKQKGIVPNVERFDAAFFGINAKLAHSMDPQMRIMLELAYEAIIDAGVNPDALRGSRTNVYIAQGVPESLAYKLCDDNVNEMGSLPYGTLSGMLASRVAYHLDLNGIAIVLDTMCSGSMSALNCAYEALSCGTCDAALVGACNLMVNANFTAAFMANDMLSMDGICRSMDDQGSGFARSEAMVMIFLQRESTARRIYAKLVHVATSSDGFKQEGISHPSIEMQSELFERFYMDIGVDPNSVAFVEMHCTGTIVGDPVECTSVDRVFCRDRDEPLLVGTIKSNMGHAESASGLCGLTKLLLSLDSGFVPPNLHFTKPRQDIPSLVAGRLKVCTETTPLPGPLCALNSFGYAGSNGHCLLRQWTKMKVNGGGPDDLLPRLVNWAGRTDESILSLFDQLASMPMDAEFIGLLHGTQETVADGSVCRGFGIFKNQGVMKDAICLAKEQNYLNEEKRPLVWIFSGMGSQWCKMGEAMVQIEIARNAIEQCHQILQPFGLDLWSIITTSDSTIFDNILHSFVGICCIQIALVDILHAVKLPVDYLIGHSVGELVCAYADGSMTLSETIMCAYWRGKISREEPLIDGLMAAVGLGYADIKDQLPAGIYVACHNSSTSCTLTGPKDSVERFVAELQSKNVFAKTVNTCGLAYHSPYIRGMQKKFHEKLQQTIDEPKLRSEKWLSTSVPKECWHLPEAKYSSAEYHLNNLLNPVLFEETLSQVPSNAMFIEIAPCGLMQPILKRELPDAIHISMMQKNSDNNSLDILKALGRIFIHGTPLCIKHLYPPIQFPVSRGTPMIAPLIKWDHGTEWTVPGESGRERSREREIVIDVNDIEYEYMKGHIIDDRCLLPAMGYLHSVRQSLLRMTPGATWDTMNVKFGDLKWIRATTLAPNDQVRLTINIQRDGRFEVTENDLVVVTGTVHIMPGPEPLTLLKVPDPSTTLTLTSHDFYKELRLRGYMYEREFCSVHTASADGRCATIEWKNNNWATFMDAMLQTSVLTKDTRTTRLPTGIREIKINAIDHLNYLKARQKSGDGSAIMCEVRTSPELNTIICGGIEITGLTTTPISRRHQNGVTVLDRYEFVALDGHDAVHSMDDAVRICTQIIHETLQAKRMRVVEVLDRNTTDAETRPIIEHLQRSLFKVPLLDVDLVLMTQRPFPDLVGIDVQSNSELPTRAESSVVVAANCMADGEFVAAAARNLIENGFLISIEPVTIQWMDLTEPNGFQLISLVRSESQSLVLMKRKPTTKATEAMDSVTIELKSGGTDYKWLRSLQEALALPSAPSITLVAQDDRTSGALGFVNCLRREKSNRKIQLVHIDCKSAPTFDSNRPPYAAQLKLGLPINILRNGHWGTYRHLNILPCVTEKEDKCRAMELHVQQAGDTSSIAWRPAKIPTNHIRILYVGLNFRDVMLANGRLTTDIIAASRIQQQNCFGAEYLGVTETGERVMGVCIYGGMRTHFDANLTSFSWRVPDHLSSREAATIPIVYATVYHAFFSHKQITAGQSILIHAGAGGVGISAIRVAIAYGLRVFTTVSSTEKRNYLLHEFPQLNENHIGNSRDCSFEKMIMDETNGIGVDYVLNSLAGEKLLASMRCVRYGGVFLEIGKFDIVNNTTLGMLVFERGIAISAIFLENLLQSPAEWQFIHDRMEADLARGIIKPLPSTVFAARDVANAFRYLGKAKHIGKVLVRMPEPDGESLITEPTIVPRMVCNPDSVYVLVGGLGGFGMEVADWLVTRGAENIVLNSRRGVTNAYQLYRIGLWKTYGVKVCISHADTASRSGCKELLMTASQYGQVDGIFNLAVVLSDHAIENQTPQSFEECLAPKAQTTRLLDELSRQLCPNLEHFVVFSSVACGLGSAGQTNYGMANAIMERIIERRVRDKLPGKAIQWGAIGDVGIVAEMLARNNSIQILGTTPQRIHTCMAIMDELVNNHWPIVSSMVISHKEQQQKLDLVGTVMSIIGITDMKSVSIQATFTQLGVDSLMSNEIRQALERDFDIRLTTEDIKLLTINRLAELASVKDQLPIALKADEPAELFGPKLIENLGNESTRNANIIEGNAAAVSVGESEQCVLVIPGIEGVASDALINFCRNLKMPAFILQLHTTHRMNDLNDVIAHVTDDILELHKNRKRFCIAAYSFGTIVAMEVARLLERESDRRGHIYLIDGCLDALHKYADSFYGCHRYRTEERFGVEIIARHLQNLPAQNRSDIAAKLAKAKTMDEQVDVFIGLFGTTKYSRGFLKEYIIGCINRLAMIEDVYWKSAVPKIDANITLMLATKSFIDCSADGIDLQTNGKIERISISADHNTILDNDVVVQMIV